MMGKYIKTTLLFLLLWMGGALSYGQSNFCGIENKVLQDGEKITFKVFYNLSAIWIGAGEAEFTTTEKKHKGKDAYHIVGTGRTYKSYDWIFRVRDRYESYIDKETLMPLRFLRDVDEGGYKFTNDVRFDRSRNVAYSSGKEFKTPQCVQDVLSAVYYARNIDYSKYAVGAKIPFSLFLDDEVFFLHIRYLGKEIVKTRYGTFNAIKIAPLLIEGTIFKGGEDMMIWVSDDDNKIPLRIDSPILVGSVKVDMIDYKNLRYPLSSLIKKR